uniref:NIDO domain-containing protein n=1 Tax=Ditylenchus dipsaci TaxID=166011 RepID=A0A915D6E6_9BILA
MLEPTKLPIANLPLIAGFGRRPWRESVLQGIHRYGKDFQTKSVIIITWEELLSEKENEEKQNKNGNVFQLALILGENACFAHIVYSKLHVTGNPGAGFNGDSEDGQHFSLPGSGTSQAMQFLEKSNIGIPGEWLFRIDDEKIFLCGAGFQGLECVDSCSSTQWYLDCSRTCHCADGNQCNSETGECPEGKCNPGWEGSPTCDQDIDECAEENIECPNEQPDCVNTPGAYLCLCFEYDNTTNTCKGE